MQRSKQKERRGLARRLRLWLPLLSVCTEMSEHCDILPYSFPCCPATTVQHKHNTATGQTRTNFGRTCANISKKHINTTTYAHTVLFYLYTHTHALQGCTELLFSKIALELQVKHFIAQNINENL